MTKMARIVDGIVGDVIVPVEGFTIEECFHPDILAMYTLVADEVQPGWVVTEGGIVPPAPAPAEEAPADTPPAA